MFVCLLHTKEIFIYSRCISLLYAYCIKHASHVYGSVQVGVGPHNRKFLYFRNFSILSKIFDTSVCNPSEFFSYHRNFLTFVYVIHRNFLISSKFSYFSVCNLLENHRKFLIKSDFIYIADGLLRHPCRKPFPSYIQFGLLHPL